MNRRPHLSIALAMLAGTVFLAGSEDKAPIGRRARNEVQPEDVKNERLTKAEKKRARKAAQRAKLANPGGSHE